MINSQTQQPLFLTLHGIALSIPPQPGQHAYFFSGMGEWRPIHGDRLSECEAVCVDLHNGFAAALMGGLDRYYSLLSAIPEFVSVAGLNSDWNVPREDTAKLIEGRMAGPDLHRLLYLYDCRKLVAGIQECTKEVCLMVGEFYRILNLDPLYPPVSEEDGIRYVTSPTVTNLWAMLNMIYIRLHSLLDYITKLAYEIDRLRDDFRTYPKLASANKLFGDRDRLGWPAARTLFEASDVVAEVELIRNHVIHDGLLDDMPKAYKIVRGGVIVEKFLLMPDRIGGRFDRYKNRAFWYGREDKINLRLPTLIDDFQSRQLATLQLARDRLEAVATSRSASRAAAGPAETP